MFTRLSVPDLLVSGMIAHARRESPLECCGLLAGRVKDGTAVITDRYKIDNAASSPTEYETDARQLLEAFRSMRERGIELLAIYHSHPTAKPVPSRRDIERNTYGTSVMHLIVSLAEAEPSVRAWWLDEADYREGELVVSPQRGTGSGCISRTPEDYS